MVMHDRREEMTQLDHFLAVTIGIACHCQVVNEEDLADLCASDGLSLHGKDALVQDDAHEVLVSWRSFGAVSLQ